MSRPDTLVPMWMRKSGNRVLDSMPERPVVVDVERSGAVLHGEVVELKMAGARIMPDDSVMLWNNVSITVRFRFADVVYTLTGTTTATHDDKSFSFDYDAVTRKHMEVLRTELKDGGYLSSSEEAADKAAEEAEEEDEEEADDTPPVPIEELMKVRHLKVPEGKDRRMHKRHDLLVQATVHKITTARFLKCQILEISLGGCRIYTEYPNTFELGDQLEVQFVGRGFPFRLSARIQFHAGQHLAGLKFLHMSMRTSDRLFDLIRELAEETISPMLEEGETLSESEEPAAEVE